jgi:hypothetical protein
LFWRDYRTLLGGADGLVALGRRRLAGDDGARQKEESEETACGEDRHGEETEQT